MRALTIRQPYASLIAHGVKRWETRTWHTKYRGPVAIHAAKDMRDFWRIWDTGHQVAYSDEAVIVDELSPLELDILPHGAVVAVANLTGCFPIVDEAMPVPDDGRFAYAHGDYVQIHDDPDVVPWYSETEIHLAPWTPGDWAWELDNIRRLPRPIPAKGRQGLWHPHGDLATEITAALLAAEIRTALGQQP